MSRLAPLTALFALLSLCPTAASAHEVLHEIERGRAVALKAWYADGEPLAYAEYAIYSPADPKIAYQIGRTDRGGYLAFVPDVHGAWRVKVFDASGHGLDVEVAIDASTGSPATPPAASTSLAFILRPLLGLAAIGLAFAALLRFHRRRGRS